MQATTTHAVIKQLNVLFARYGVPKNKVCLKRNIIGLIDQREDVDGFLFLLDEIIEYYLLNTSNYFDDKNLRTLKLLNEKFNWFLKEELKLNVIHYLFKEWNIDLISSCGLILVDILNLELVHLIDNLKANNRDQQILKAKELRLDYGSNAKRTTMQLELRKKIVAEIEKIISRDLVDLETSLYSATENFENGFIYTSLLFELSKYSYPNKVDKWFTQKISTEKRNDPNKNSTTDINMFNSTSEGEGPAIKAFLDDVKDKNKDCSLYFHGTTQASAQSILTSGIILEKGKDENDFSNGSGFYVAESFKTANDIVNGSGAIVVFKIPNSMVDASLENGLNLDREQDEPMWKDIILYCRRHPNRKRTTDSLLKDKNFIRGPMCTNAEAIKPDKKKRNREKTNQIQPEGFSEREMQICIRKDEFSTRFGSIENICCVIFYAKYS
uniref:Uncharacterized protein n=1 Tax=Biomphalaria glabrata TaxID=6526 RepID=A0A2C9M263_BIOGL